MRNKEITLQYGDNTTTYRQDVWPDWTYEEDGGTYVVPDNTPLRAALDRLAELEHQEPQTLVSRLRSLGETIQQEAAEIERTTYDTEAAFDAAWAAFDSSIPARYDRFAPEILALEIVDNQPPFTTIVGGIDLNEIPLDLDIPTLPAEADLGNGWTGTRSTKLRIVESDFGRDYLLRNSRVTLTHETTGLSVRTHWSIDGTGNKGSAQAAGRSLRKKLAKNPNAILPIEERIVAFDTVHRAEDAA